LLMNKETNIKKFPHKNPAIRNRTDILEVKFQYSPIRLWQVISNFFLILLKIEMKHEKLIRNAIFVQSHYLFKYCCDQSSFNSKSEHKKVSYYILFHLNSNYLFLKKFSSGILDDFHCQETPLESF
jgi:hypothetical protein